MIKILKKKAYRDLLKYKDLAYEFSNVVDAQRKTIEQLRNRILYIENKNVKKKRA